MHAKSTIIQYKYHLVHMVHTSILATQHISVETPARCFTPSCIVPNIHYIRSSIIWVHSGMAIVYMMILIGIMIRFRLKISRLDNDQVRARSEP